jgi:two-component system, cell cycle response regulator DivK
MPRTQRRILVVEDDSYSRDLLVSILTFHGYETFRATNGRQAVDLAQVHTPDLIIMDISMPIMNGLDATREIKRDARIAHIPIIAMSAYDAREDEKEANKAGCVDFLAKPLELFRLKERIEAIFVSAAAA